MKRTALLFLCCLTIGCLFSSNCLAAEDAAAFYKGKTINVFVPSAPGGTFDLLSRVIAPYLEKYTGARTLLQNSVNIQAQNTLVRTKPDGLSVVLSGHGPKEITAQLFKQQGVNFDWTKFTLLGRIPSSSTAFAVDRKMGWKKPADLQGKAFFARRQQPFLRAPYLPRRWAGIKCRSFPACRVVKGHWRCAGVKFKGALEALPRCRKTPT